jgi:predicted dehydrogenase
MRGKLRTTERIAMPRTVIVGLGRSGAGLHLPVLARLRHAHPELIADHPIVGFDPHPGVAVRDIRTVESVDRLAALVPPAEAVVHVCTPPGVRLPVLERLAEQGFRRFVVEKPLAADLATLAAVERLCAGLDVVIVTQWLAAALTRRLAAIVRSGEYGPPLSLAVRQDKPRFTRSSGHADAFEVEIPHALAVALHLLGPAEVTGAGWTDPVRGPLAGAWLSLRHRGGAHTTVHSDLTAPVRRRELTLRLRDTAVVGHYPVSADDHHAQLRIGGGDREVFEDEALGAFLLAAYRYFAGLDPAPPGDLGLHAGVVRLLTDARRTADREVTDRAG